MIARATIGLLVLGIPSDGGPTYDRAIAELRKAFVKASS